MKTEDWIKQMFGGFHTGGVYKPGESPLRPNEVPIRLPVLKDLPASPTGRHMEPPSRMEPIEHVVVVPGRQHGKSLRHAAGLAEVDYASIERRVMAQMAAAMTYPGMVDRARKADEERQGRKALNAAIHLFMLHAIDKQLAYLFAYGAVDAVQTRIDEEGCGAVFAAAKDWPDE